MFKKSRIVLIAVALCLVLAPLAFAEDTIDWNAAVSDTVYPNDYIKFDVRGDDSEGYSLAEVYWFNPTVYSVEVLEFLQAYMLPEDPVSFYMQAAEFTDEEIDDYAVIFQSFVEPEYAGAFPYRYRCDIEELEKFVDVQLNDPNLRYTFTFYFENPAILTELFPRGIGRADAYDTFRRCALSLAIYSQKHGMTEGSKFCIDYIQQVIAYYEQQYDEAMAAEQEAQQIVEIEVSEGSDTEDPVEATEIN